MATLDHPRYDVAVVGASIAGCAAAMFFARRGLQVALIVLSELKLDATSQEYTSEAHEWSV